jgi:AcrR family transcriptional regulator
MNTSTRRRRRDAQHNEQRLLDAAGQLLAKTPAAVTMPAVAEAAGVSIATAYRFFPTFEDLHTAFLTRVVLELRDFSHDCPKTGAALFDEVAREWIALVGRYGPAMVQLRSRRGVLERLDEDDAVIRSVRDAWERPLKSLLRAHGLSDAEFPMVLLLYNQLFDPREIVDLSRHGLDAATIQRRLTAALIGALRGWIGSGAGARPTPDATRSR